MRIQIEEVKTKSQNGNTEVRFVILCGKTEDSMEVLKYESTLVVTEDLVTMAENPSHVVAKLKMNNAISVFEKFYIDKFLTS